MRLYRKYCAFIFSLLLLVMPVQPAFALDYINVMGPKSMSVALTEIARNYALEHKVSVNNSFVSPSLQQQQIEEGGAADILITPRTEWLDELRQQGLFDIYSKTLIAKNELVLVGPQNTSLEIDLYQGFPAGKIVTITNYEQGFVVGNPENLEEGAYAKDALRAMQVLDYLEPYTLFPRYLDQMFSLIESRDAYGVFFRSSTAGRKNIKILSAFPEGSYAPIEYYAVVIAGENMEKARDFLAYMQTEKSTSIFRANGFVIN